MQETEIRQKTEEILEAYEALTGTSAVPSIAEFLDIRKTALEELGRQRKPRTQTAKPEEKTMTANPVSAGEQGRVPFQPSDIQIRRSDKSKVRTIARHPAAEGEKTSSENAADAMSDFEILHTLADPWN